MYVMKSKINIIERYQLIGGNKQQICKVLFVVTIS